MKYWLVFWVITGPVDDMKTREFAQEFSTMNQCTTALAITQAKLESLPDFRAAALKCVPDDSNLRSR